MNLIKRTLTAAVLLGSLFVIIQYAPDWVFFLFGAGLRRWPRSSSSTA